MVFVSASLWEEMGKAVCYKVDASTAGGGVIHESQCACTGQGPSAYCKHVQTVLYVLVAFSKGRDILTEITLYSGKVSWPFLVLDFKKKIHCKIPLAMFTLFSFFVCLYDRKSTARNRETIQKRHRDVTVNWPVRFLK